MRGQLVQLHDRGGVEAGDVVESRDARPRGVGARIDADDIAAHELRPTIPAMDFERAGADEARFSTHERHTRGVQPPLAARAEPLDDLLLAPTHVREVHGDRSGAHAEVVRAAGEVRDARAGDHGLGGRAPDVDAGPADVRALDERGPPAGAGERGGERAARLPRADDHDVEPLCIHGSARLE